MTRVESGDQNLATSRYDPYLKKIGLITLEDIIEEVIDADIEDEYEGHDQDALEERRL